MDDLSNSLSIADVDKRDAVERLCRTGFIPREARTGLGQNPYSLIATGEKLLSARGAGLNEA